MERPFKAQVFLLKKGGKKVNEVNFQEAIVKVARDLFERIGQVEGNDLDNLLEAERTVVTQHRPQLEIESKTSTSKKKTSTIKTEEGRR